MPGGRTSPAPRAAAGSPETRSRPRQPLPVSVTLDGPPPVEARAGRPAFVVLHGGAVSPAGRIVAVVLTVGGTSTTLPFQAFPRPDRSGGAAAESAAGGLFSGFAVAWSGVVATAGEVPLSLAFQVETAGGARRSETIPAGRLVVRPPAAPRRLKSSVRVAVAMATYAPEPERLAAQLASIEAQSVADWRLVVSDETQDPEGRDAVARMLRGRPRVRLIHGPRRGVTGNFGRALDALDADVPFFALADQDDVWRPDKLERLLAGIGEADLVYGDSRIVDARGAVVDGSFFSWRRRHGDALADLLNANTVSGAALLGRRALLDRALPFCLFPGLYHDWWLAVAAARGRGVRFLEAVVQDYVQHPGNTVGHDARRDRAAARRFDAEARRLAAALNEIARGPPSSAPATGAVVSSPARFAVTPEALGLSQADLGILAVVGRTAVQKAILAAFAGAGHADGGAPAAPDLSLAALAAVADRLAAAPGADDPRRCLGVPAWLAIGTRLLDAIARRPPLLDALAARPARESPDGD